MKHVTVIQEHLPHYRAGFFELLRPRLQQLDVTIDLIHAAGGATQFVRADVPWSLRVGLVRCGGFVWHRNTLLRALKSDLIISVHELKYLTPSLLQFLTRFRGPKFAYWGHGCSFQAQNRNSLRERIKRNQARRVDWWFAYNDLSAKVVRELGFSEDRITSVCNAIDTVSLREHRAALTADELLELHERHNIRSDNVAIYTGGLYQLKRIQFLLDAVAIIRKMVPDFEFIVIGDGPERNLVEDAAARFPWIHAVGVKDDRAKVPYWALSKLLLMPGGVGLVVLDSFALGVPMVTTDTHLHGPEIDYLSPGENGVLVRCGDDVRTYAEAVVDLLLDDGKREALAARALASSGEFTLEKMVDNFVAGIARIFDRAPV